MSVERTYEYRPLGIDDVEGASAIERTVFPREAWSKAILEGEFTSEWSTYWGAFDGGELVGYGGVKGDVEGDLMTLAVLPNYRGRGIGKEVLTHLLAAAQNAGMKTVFLEVRKSNHVAQRLYETFGFRELTSIRDYYRDPTEDAVVMRAAL